MKRIRLGVGAFAFLLLAASTLFSQEQAAAPAYRDGDYWWYRFAGKVYELAIVEGKLKIFDPKPDQKVAIEGERAEELANLVEIGEAKKDFLDFPLSIGKKWSSQYDTGKQRTVRRGGTATLMRTATSQVTGIEDVKTPAGTFRAFKIERSESQRQKDSISGSLYYSPQTRSVVKYEFALPDKPTRVIELTKYGAAGEK
ncbi:MAG: hypothetical protein ACREQP_11270 [Candidatus Binatia bacterium]